jgi:hypothetical protein
LPGGDSADHEVVGHPVQPRPDLIWCPARLDLAGQPQERFLEEVLGSGIVTRRPTQEPEQLVPMGSERVDQHAREPAATVAIAGSISTGPGCGSVIESENA